MTTRGSTESEVSKSVLEIDACIEEAWEKLRNEKDIKVGWDEQQLVFPFYFCLRPLIAELNLHFNSIWLSIVPQYALKASSHAPDFGGAPTYPVLRDGKTPFKYTKKVDLAVVAFDFADLERMKNKEGATYWYIIHWPLVLMELKFLVREELFDKLKSDVDKLAKIQQTYEE